MHLFYIPSIKNASNYTLSENESKHCVRVLRLGIGDGIHLADGKGNLYAATIVNAHDKHCEVKIDSIQEAFEKRPYYLHLAVAPTKNIERYEWFLEKATEIGIDEITPIICQHSERRQVKCERLEKVIIAAAKQSLKAYLPILNPAILFDEFIIQEFSEKKCIAHCAIGDKVSLQHHVVAKEAVLLMIGAEGDFSALEIDRARQHKFTEVSLGNARLRTETAAVVAACTLAMKNNTIE
ncbi:MAG: 16S rRNA (uracil(1498)-N(3))-methyltransferase [Bacteroidales bacterium]